MNLGLKIKNNINYFLKVCATPHNPTNKNTTVYQLRFQKAHLPVSCNKNKTPTTNIIQQHTLHPCAPHI